MTAPLAWPLVLPVCGEEYAVTRSLDRARRIETVLGPILPLAERLEKGHVTHAELTLVYAALLHGERTAPARATIEAWIFETGVLPVARRVAFFVASLVYGHEVAAKIADRVQATVDAEAKADGPFSSAAA